MGSAHPGDVYAAPYPRDFIKYSDGLIHRAFSVEYRLSSTTPYPTRGAFPAGLLDTLSAYLYLVHTLDFSPQNIIVVGDSAGGHFAVTLVRYLRLLGNADPEHTYSKYRLVPPGAVILSSSGLDLGGSHLKNPESTWSSNAHCDYIGALDNTDYIYRSTRGTHTQEEIMRNVWFSPASLELPNEDVGGWTGFPPTLMLCGDAEQLLDAMRTFRDRVERDNVARGPVVEYCEYKDAMHAFVAMDWAEPQRSEALRKYAEWIKTVFEDI